MLYTAGGDDDDESMSRRAILGQRIRHLCFVGQFPYTELRAILLQYQRVAIVSRRFERDILFYCARTVVLRLCTEGRCGMVSYKKTSKLNSSVLTGYLYLYQYFASM
jgi:hypothetical protein